MASPLGSWRGTVFLSVCLAAVLLHIFHLRRERRAGAGCRPPVLGARGEGEGEEEGGAPVAGAGGAGAGGDGRPQRAPTALWPLARTYVVSVGSADLRWSFMEESLGHVFDGQTPGLPRWRRFDAATPLRDGCDLPYSLSDCCTRSHMNVLLNFSSDPEVREDQWVLVLEDDVALHPTLAPHRVGDVITAGLKQATRVMSGFMYLGLCSPACSGEEVTLAYGRGGAVSFRSRCGGFCTHAYAVQKFLARRIPDYVASMQGKQRTIDQALFRLATALNMSLLGSSLKSRDIRSVGSVHAGVFFMKAFSDSLTIGEWELKPKVVFRLTEWSGRIGNLMFEWASVASLAARAGADTQAHFVVNGHQDTPECPANSFFKHFRLQRFSRDAADVRLLKPRCTVTFQETGPSVYSKEGVAKMLAEIKAIEAGTSGKTCRLLEVYVTGYLQSYKYFRGYEERLRLALAPPPRSQAKASAWIKRLRARLSEKNPGVTWYLVGVQVRRGDKVHTPGFSAIYMPTEWTYYQAGMALLAKRLAGGKADAKVAFVITSGGSMKDHAKDVEESKKALRAVAAADWVLTFVEGTDPYTDYALLASTDALVISSSSFGWWAAYVSKAGTAQGLVVAPRHIYRPGSSLAQGFKFADYYPPNWEILNNTGRALA